MPKIVTIGGGTGAPIIIQALLQAGFKNISCICASMDSGGKTGLIRSDERDQVIAVSDLLRNLIALISSANHKKNISAFIDLVSFIDGRQRNLGYAIYYALLEKYQNDFLKVQDHLENLLGIKFGGTAIPITTASCNLYFETQSGQIFRGEHELDKQSMSKNMITKLWLEPPVLASPEALEALSTADYVIYCPGSLYGSILANFLPEGVKEALAFSKAQKILITNLVSNRNQTHKYTPQKYFKIFQKYTGLKKPFETIITPDTSKKQFDKRYPKIASSYAHEHAHFIGWNKKQLSSVLQGVSSKGLRSPRGDSLQGNYIKILTSDIISITPQLNRLRHDPQKLAKIFQKIIK